MRRPGTPAPALLSDTRLSSLLSSLLSSSSSPPLIRDAVPPMNLTPLAHSLNASVVDHRRVDAQMPGDLRYLRYAAQAMP